MKKIFTFLFCITLSLSVYIPVHAQENTIIYSGYTTEDIYYSVREIETQSSMTRATNNTLYVVREFTYAGIIDPLDELEWEEQNKGITYTGTLKLRNYSYSGGNTVATYTGTLVKK